MKKFHTNIYLSFILIVTSLISGISQADTPLNRSPISDNNFKRCITEQMITNNLQYVEEIEHLDCNNKNIRSLSGIEDLENLTIFSAIDNQIEDVNLLHNTSLKIVNLNNNNISRLTLPRDYRSDLKQIFIDNNKLSILRISDYVQLLLISAKNNQLTHVDISNNPELMIVDLESNLLTRASIKHNNSLSSVNLNNNRIKFLASQDIMWSEKNGTLSINNNSLTSISTEILADLIILEAKNNNLDLKTLDTIHFLQRSDSLLKVEI